MWKPNMDPKKRKAAITCQFYALLSALITASNGIGRGTGERDEPWVNGRMVGHATALKCDPPQSDNLVGTGAHVTTLTALPGSDGTEARVVGREWNNTPYQLWDIWRDLTVPQVATVINVATNMCMGGDGGTVGARPFVWPCGTGNVSQQQIFLQPVQAVPACSGDWFTYRLRAADYNSSNCLTQLQDGTLMFEPCLPNWSDPTQNFFLQTGSSVNESEAYKPPMNYVPIIAGVSAGAGILVLATGLTALLWALRRQRQHGGVDRVSDSRILLSLVNAAGGGGSSRTGYSTTTAGSTNLGFSSGESGDESPQRRALELLVDVAVAPEEIRLEQGANGRPILLGRGAYGKVYVGTWKHKRVAVKMLLDNEEEAQLQFCAEAKRLQALRHPNIVMFLGACLQPDFKMMVVTELCEGGDLAKALLRDEEEPRLLGWYQRGHSLLLDVAYGLAYLHSNKICHLDVKPGNVLLDRAWLSAKISDVGLSRAILGSHASVATLRGTWRYMAPELLTNEHAVTFAVDIYSFGVTMHEVITGETLGRGPLPMPRVPEQCPPEAVELYLNCTNVDPRNRPTAADLVKAMQALRPRSSGPVTSPLQPPL